MTQPGGGATTEWARAASGPEHARHGRSGAGWSKVPEVAALFWIVKVLTTGMGETASDYLGRTLGPIPAGAVGLVGIATLLTMQFRADRYRPWIYWSAIVMVSVFGTMAADVFHVVAGVPYTVSTVMFCAALAGVLTAWYVSEKTLSIHSIRTRRRETFYWTTVLTTFALGTAIGDLTAGTLHLGYLSSGILFAVAIAAPALSGRFAWLSPVAAFWSAYILTRPLGASFADWMGVPAGRGGVGWGTGPVTLALLVPIIALVSYLAVSRKDTPAEQRTAAGAVG
ncbi:putative membrane-anchored protein [Streptomyces olivoverticillatus]|uniref:Putative membrane-anchored protein n=1 Tax=Streptomyces olivoverticillatus TaxID=66427 RepID=A0A7W7PKV7_9ACTN|nr:hypothetical protein [Streptomyces olivoverticillatus]MBB4893644.1 putative membrane-anchored protein [Streptomyces olivoverticillatus]